jgi:hypothetical protein
MSSRLLLPWQCADVTRHPRIAIEAAERHEGDAKKTRRVSVTARQEEINVNHPIALGPQ